MKSLSTIGASELIANTAVPRMSRRRRPIFSPRIPAARAVKATVSVGSTAISGTISAMFAWFGKAFTTAGRIGRATQVAMTMVVGTRASSRP